MKYTEEYITNNADTFDWEYFDCEQTFYSEEFMDRFKYKIRRYTLNGLYHSYKNNPAIIDLYGTKSWYKDGDLHRDNDLPAIIDVYGTKVWHKNGNIHRDNDNPAVIYGDGRKRWYKNGKKYFPTEQFN